MTCLTSSNIIFKYPADILNVSMDFSDTELIADGETIDSANITITPSGVTAASVTINGFVVYFSISGGVTGTNYTVAVVIETSDGQTITGEGALKVRDR